MRKINLRYFDSGEVGLSIDETTSSDRAKELLAVFAMAAGSSQVCGFDELPELITLKEEQLRESPLSLIHI